MAQINPDLPDVGSDVDAWGPIVNAAFTALINQGNSSDAALAIIAETIRDTVAATLVAGANVTLTVDDAGNTITIAATGGGGGAVTSVAGKTGVVVLAAADIASGTFVPARLPAASETAVGGVALATAAETTTGTDNTRAVHPAGLKVELDKKATTTALNAKVGSSDGTITNIRKVTAAAHAALVASPPADHATTHYDIVG